MLKHYLLLLLLSLVFSSCEFEVANNTRMAFSGSVVDEDRSPIPDIPVFLEGNDDGESHVLGEGFTNRSGKFQVISLKTDLNNLYINQTKSFYYFEDFQENADSVFTSVTYINVPGSLDLGTIVLRRKAELNFKINKTSTSNDTLYWKLSYTHPTCQNVFEDGFLLEEESSCYERFPDSDFNMQTSPKSNFENRYKTVLGGTAEFTYRLNQAAEQTILLNIDQIHETYVFEY